MLSAPPLDGWQLYRMGSLDARMRAAANRIRRCTFADDHEPHHWRHGWIPIDAESIQQSSEMQDLLGKSDWDVLANGRDGYLAEIARQKGFDGPPSVVDKATFTKAISSGSPEMLRRVSSKKYATEYKTGDYYPGKGQFGSGTYTLGILTPQKGRSQEVSKELESYGSGKLRMTLSPKARTVTLDEIKKLQKPELDTMKTELKKIDPQAAMTPEQIKLSRWYGVIRDPGRYAALHGYDAIVVGEFRGTSEILVLNRAATIVDGSV